MLPWQDTRKNRRRAGPPWLFLLVVAGLGFGGCKSRTKASNAASDDATPRGILQLRVDPPQGISVLLDGNKVAHASPYSNPEVAAGAHVLEVRGMGRYPVTLPFSMAPGGRVEVPVVLRTRAATPLVDGQGPAGKEPLPLAGAAAPMAPNGPAPHLAPAHGRHAPLPAGSTPLRLAVAPTPPAKIVADGQQMADNDVRLGYGQGVLEVGEMRLVYRVYPGRALEFTVPHEPVPWFLGDQQIKAKSVVRATASPLVLRRGTGPTEQRAWIRRLE